MMMTDDTRMDLHLLFFGSKSVSVALKCCTQLTKKLLLNEHIIKTFTNQRTMTCCPN